MIEVTQEMKAAFRAAQEQRAGELVAEGAPLGAHDILDRGLTAVLAVVERDFYVGERIPLPTPCTAETWSWDHFNSAQVDGYWIRCTLQGVHDDHRDEHTGLAWTGTSPYEPSSGGGSR